jgi:hypothetical protein
VLQPASSVECWPKMEAKPADGWVTWGAQRVGSRGTYMALLKTQHMYHTRVSSCSCYSLRLERVSLCNLNFVPKSVILQVRQKCYMVGKRFGSLGSPATGSLRGQDGWGMQGTWQSGETKQ